jgi:DNA-binding NtrC family response regulator
VARALVERSPRAKAPFIKVDCNIPENLAEIEFFGVVANYPGFHREEPKTGLFELANGGTLFLDEIGDLALSVQPKLNRALEEGEIRWVGGEQVIPVDVRVIAATNRDLEQAIREGKFRADLFYRLNVVNVEVPPLRDRKEDIPLLVAHFVKMYARKLRRPPPDIAPEGLELLQRYHYPGNVRELENIMERAVILTEGDTILPDVLPVEVVEGPSTSNLVPSEHKFADTKNDFEKNYVETLLRETRGNVTRAAEKAGIDRKNFREKIKKHGLNAADYRKAS